MIGLLGRFQHIFFIKQHLFKSTIDNTLYLVGKIFRPKIERTAPVIIF
jgi:hypothetical protein